MSGPNFPKDDLYKVLGIDNKASLDDIKKAYRDLCMKVHPDKAEGGNTPENNERFQKVQEAWEILRDDVLRKEYDDYRANGGKYGDKAGGSSKRDGYDDDSGRRRKDDRRRDRSGKRKSSRRRSKEPGSNRGKDRADHNYRPENDTSYGSKPSDRSKPYYEEWGGDDFYDPGYESGQSQHHRHHEHRHHTGSFYYGAGAHSPPRDEYRRPRSSPQDDTNNKGPSTTPQPTRLEDRIIAMRMRVDLRRVGETLDNLHEDRKDLGKGFNTTFKLSKSDQEYLNSLLDDVHRAIEHAEDLYDDLHLRLKEIETGRWTAPSVVYELPEVLGILQAHVTRMKYAASAAFCILGQLSGYPHPTPAEELQLFKRFQGRLSVMARPTWLPTYLRST